MNEIANMPVTSARDREMKKLKGQLTKVREARGEAVTKAVPTDTLATGDAIATVLRDLLVLTKAVAEVGYGVDASQYRGLRATQKESLCKRSRRRRHLQTTAITSMEKMPEAEDALPSKKRRRRRRGGHWQRAVQAGAAAGGGRRFQALEQDVAEREGVTNPGAVAAAIGRRKYGKKRFAGLAARGRMAQRGR